MRSIPNHALLIRVISLLLILLLTGSHWALLQGVAWSSMMFDSSRGATVVERAESTFSGQQPCSLCIAIQDGVQEERQETERRASRSHEEVRLTAVPTTPPTEVCRHQFEAPFRVLVAVILSQARPAPPTPPPIAA